MIIQCIFIFAGLYHKISLIALGDMKPICKSIYLFTKVLHLNKYYELIGGNIACLVICWLVTCDVRKELKLDFREFEYYNPYPPDKQFF